jgi:peptidoglycan-associated lipoprotein
VSTTFRARPLAVGFAALTVLAATACSPKVDKETYEADMAAVRADISGLDSRVGTNEEQIAAIQTRIDELESELGELRDEFDVTVARLENGIRFTTPVHFAFNDATVRSTDHELLNRFADVVSHHYDGALITVEGFADPAGSRSYNQRLSERRAASVATYLESNGLAGANMRTVGYGEDRLVEPGAQGPGESGLVNRRVAFVIDYAPEAPESSEDMVTQSQDENETT